MQRALLPAEEKAVALPFQADLDRQARTRKDISENLIVENLSWEQYKKIFADIKTLASETEAMVDLKLWFEIFKKAVEFNRTVGKHSTELSDQWRSILEAHNNVLSRLASKLEEHPDDRFAMNSFITAVDYKTELVYPDFRPDVNRIDGADRVIFDQYKKDADKLRNKQRWNNFKSWCCMFCSSGSSAQQEQESEYVSFESSPTHGPS
jgi:hypothetical protein